MPHPDRKGGVNKRIIDEKRTFVGLQEPKKNLMDQYVVKQPAVAAVIRNAGQPSVFQQEGKNFRQPQQNQLLPNCVGAIDSDNRAGGASKVLGLDGRYRNPPIVFDSLSDSEDNHEQDYQDKRGVDKTSKPDIITYYKLQGKDYFQERRKCRQMLSRRPSEFSPLSDMQKMAGGVVIWDDYVPPPGYTKEEIEAIPIPDDSINESPLGHTQYNKKAPIMYYAQPDPSPSPVQSTQQFNDILKQLQSIDENRVKNKQERLKRKEEKRKLKLAESNRNMEMENDNDEERDCSMTEEQKGNLSSGGLGEFPKDLNDDSFLTLATQLEEDRINSFGNKASAGQLVRSNQTIKCNVLSPRNRQIGGNTPVSSDARNSFRSKYKLRQRSGENIGKRIPMGKLDFSTSPGNSSGVPDVSSSNSNESLFDKSSELVAAQKVFNVVGDFCEDEDDDVFSQIPMPDQPGKTVPINEKSTVLVNGPNGAGFDDSESYLSSDALMELDRLEEKATGVKNNKVYTSTPNQNPVRFTPPEVSFAAKRRSDRIKALGGYTPPRNQTNDVNMPTEKAKGGSKLSRSFRLRK